MTPDELIAYRWDLAELRRMQRSDAERDAMLRRCARMWVRFVVWKLRRKGP